jgi:hypothetical protein
MGRLQKSAPTIQQFQCSELLAVSRFHGPLYLGHLHKGLLSGNKREPGVDVTIAKVAALSEHAFEAPRKGSGSNPVLTPGGATNSAPVASLQILSSVSTSSGLDRATNDVEQERIETEIVLSHERLVRRVSSRLTPVLTNYRH